MNIFKVVTKHLLVKTFFLKGILFLLFAQNAFAQKIISNSTNTGMYNNVKVLANSNKVFSLFCILVLYILLIVLRFYYPKYIEKLFKLYKSKTVNTRIVNDEKFTQLLPALYYDILFFTLFAIWLTIFQFLSYNILPNQAIGFFYKNLLIITLFVFVKRQLTQLIAWVFKFQFTAKVLLNNAAVTRYLMVFILLPVITFLLLLSQTYFLLFILYLSATIMVLMASFNILKSVIWANKNSIVQNLHFFLYLCTFEITPLVLLVVYLHRQLATPIHY